MPKLKPETLAARKAHILTAALTCFAGKGYYQTTMDDIMREAGLSKGGVYVHFDSKRELFLALFDWALAETGLLQSLTVTGATAYERLVNAVDGMATAVASPAFREMSPLMVDMWLQNMHDPDFKQMVASQYAQFRQPLTHLIEEGVTDGSFKPVEAASLANILLATFDGLMVQVLVDETAVNWTAVSQTLHILIAGLLI
ncbi:MAG: TetR/AcrR family transcriptional regulator [Chloroflexi bacterium]|nr:TetR/AcrR family transcriptional regulator [Chloroflexota bacterium]